MARRTAWNIIVRIPAIEQTGSSFRSELLYLFFLVFLV